MPIFAKYDSSTGRFLSNGYVSNPDDVPLQAQPGEAILEGVHGKQGDVVVDGQLTPYVETFDSKKKALRARVSERRWEIETGGVGGIDTDDRSKLLLFAAAEKARLDPNYTTRWKTESGWIPVDAPTILSIQAAIYDHVSRCFAREEQLTILVDACLTQEDLDALSPTVEQFFP